MATDENKSHTVTFDESAAETIVQSLGWGINANGVIVDPETATLVRASDGAMIHIHELGGIVPDENGDPQPMRDDFASIVGHVKGRGEPDG